MNDIEDLENEIEVLKKRIEILESCENKRKISKNIHAIIKICLFLLFIYGVYKGYEYIKQDVPNIIESKIKEIKILGK